MLVESMGQVLKIKVVKCTQRADNLMFPDITTGDKNHSDIEACFSLLNVQTINDVLSCLSSTLHLIFIMK